MAFNLTFDEDILQTVTSDLIRECVYKRMCWESLEILIDMPIYN